MSVCSSFLQKAVGEGGGGIGDVSKKQEKKNPLSKPEEERTPYEKIEVATKKVVGEDKDKEWHKRIK